MVNEDNWLTITELSDTTKIADSTIRRYLHTFEVFFKHDENVRGKRYEKNAIEVLNRIRELYEKGYDNRKVFSFLDEEFTPFFDSEKVNSDSGDTHENSHENTENSRYIKNLSEDLAEIKAALNKQEQFNSFLIETVLKQGQTIQELVEELERQRLSLPLNEVAATISETDLVEETKEEVIEEKTKKGFWSRLFG